MTEKKKYKNPKTEFIRISENTILAGSNENTLSVKIENSKEATTGITPMSKQTSLWEDDPPSE